MDHNDPHVIIIKVQISTSSNTGKKQVLMYDEKRALEILEAADDDLLKLMNGRQKVFFLAYLNEDNGSIDFKKELDDQGW